MYVVASFEFSDGLEIAVADLENEGIKKEEILVIPLDKRTENTRLFDSIYSSDGKSLVDFAAILGAIFMLIGGIYGFVLPIGPIFCALIGLVGGLLIGFLFDLLYTRHKTKNVLTKTNLTEVFVMVHCQDAQVDKVKKVLWDQFALGIATLDREENIE
ncbi:MULTISPECIES: hypothetical protein [Bacillaceae]|uniref:hypothetical protein n=1 Tax=Bacillaceae TaxID=186817 RepID=UPI000BFD5A62|nr:MULTISPECIES: hypothetical protein [Bacillaceae]PGT81151.1 hypothetical protein COD11_18595 [Bacillus sp. AFS040349]UGB31564.1 hypothetical protein LPC09_03525 [Metabacillus sp. B2-18]